MPTVTICSAFDLITPIVLNEPTVYFPRTAKINIRSYLAPRIEYQYEGEPKQTIYSTGGELTYALKELGGQCSGDSYKITYQIAKNGVDACSFDGLTTKTIFARGKIIGLKAAPTGSTRSSTCDLRLHWSKRPAYPQYLMYLATEDKPDLSSGAITIIYFIQYDPSYLEPIGKIVKIENQSRAIDCTTCTFTVTETFSDGRTETRHQETRDVCPTVQQFDCELEDDVQTITVKLDSFEALFASDGTDINNPLIEFFEIGSDIVNYLSGNPDNCLLIWTFNTIK